MWRLYVAIALIFLPAIAIFVLGYFGVIELS